MAVDVPPEALLMEYGNNFSASRQTAIDFEQIIQQGRSRFSSEALKLAYQDVFIGSVLTGDIMPTGFLEAIITGDRMTVNAWLEHSFRGTTKPSVDALKSVKTHEAMVANGFSDREKVAADYYGTSYDDNVRKLRRQNIKLAEANEPIAHLQKTGTLKEEDEDNNED